MYGYVYKITNKINGKIYIGKRVSEVFDEKYWGSGKILNNAIAKYGIENFDREVLQWYNNDIELNEGEIYWINEFNSIDHNIGYNISPGGTGGDTFTNNTIEAKDKMRKKISETITGRIAVHKDNRLSYINKEELSDYQLNGWELGGLPKTEDQKLKISEKLKNYVYITNGIENKRVNINVINEYDGFHVGFTYIPSEKQIESYKNRTLKAEEKYNNELEIWLSEDHYCETCGKKLITKYGSGRFCSKSCATTHKHSQETKDYISSLNKLGICGRTGKKNSNEHNQKISLSNKGKCVTEATRKKLSDSHIGKPVWNKDKKGIFGWRLVNGKREYYKK